MEISNRFASIQSRVLSLLFGVLLVCWPVLDLGPTGAVTPLRIGCAAVVLGLLAVAVGRSRRIGWVPTDWLMLACAVWLAVGVILVNRGETDPYPLLNGITLLASYAFWRLVGSGRNILLPAVFVSGLLQAGVATAQLCGMVASRHTYYDFTGSFTNPGPLGGWLCVSVLAVIVLIFRLLRSGRRRWAMLCAAGGLYIGIVLVLTDSRAAWLGLGAGGFYGLSMLKFRHKRPVLLALAGVALVGTIWLYGYKKDSADGRFLVWRVSTEMITERPIAGQGVGTFSEKYMFRQADYFRRYPDSRFAEVADDVSYPFNEVIGVACEGGLVGALLLLLLAGSVLLRRGGGRGARAVFAGLFVFALFSYPSQFMAYGLLSGALLAEGVNKTAATSRRFRYALLASSCMVGAGVVALQHLYADGSTLRCRYTLIREASRLVRRGDVSDLPRIEELARRLPVSGLYVGLGDLCLTADRAERAKVYYRQAANMVPARLGPYYGLFRCYLRTGQPDSAALLARRIVTMPVKVSNTATIRIRGEAADWLGGR